MFIVSTAIHNRSKEEYLDKYKGIRSEILNTTRFDENSDLSTTYLGKINTTQELLLCTFLFPLNWLQRKIPHPLYSFIND